MPLILGANSVTGGYEVDNSLRFNSGKSDYLQEHQVLLEILKLGHILSWTKKKCIGNSRTIFIAGPMRWRWKFEDQLDSTFNKYINLTYDGLLINVFTNTQLFRDVSAWYHIVLQLIQHKQQLQIEQKFMLMVQETAFLL
jgi:hypothetical protein